METFRYLLALLLVCILTPMLVYWPLIHIFIGFWRRLGPGLTYGIVWAAMFLAAFGLYQARCHLLRIDCGTNWSLVISGILCLGVATWARVLLHRDITNKLILGLPELAPDRHPQGLVRTGLYSCVRHPRYLQFLLAQLGWALIANYLMPYVVWFLWVATLNLIVRLEERELRDRFGEEYERYSREVPRFIPRFRR